MSIQKIHMQIQLNFYHLIYILALQNNCYSNKLKVNLLLFLHLLSKTCLQLKKNIAINLNIMDNIPLTRICISQLHNNTGKS